MADGMTCSSPPPIVEFFKLIPDGRPPKRADKTAAGYMPGRAMRYCDALTASAGYGYWIFPVIDMQLLWDGDEIFWSQDDGESWLSISRTSSTAIQFPGFEEYFDERAPEELHGFSPPFLTALPEPGSIQIWTGLVARTRPGWSLSIRSPVNLPGIVGTSAWEGMIETDQWFGPIFTIFRITKTDFPVRLRAAVPFLQVQPVPQLAYRDTLLNSFQSQSLDDLSLNDWQELGQVIKPDPVLKANAGSYSVGVRKRRSCPVHSITVQTTIEDDEERFP